MGSLGERDYYVGFSNFPGIGPVRFKILLSKFGSAKSAWEAPGGGLGRLIGEKLAGKFEEFRKEFSIEKYLEKLKNSPTGDVWFVTDKDKDYPTLLSKIPNPPFLLYGRGSKEILKQVQDDNARTIAVVGTRKITRYGEEVTQSLTSSLVNNGFRIVSGLAVGVDAVAHRTAIENGGSPRSHLAAERVAGEAGKTIAVLGCGVDCCTPTENLSLYNSIVKSGGCIISEYPLSQIPTKGSFPARNRIIAGISEGVLVTEGAEDSGSLITADYALKFGRKVFAVPGPITSSLSKGPFKLLQKGAKLVTSAEDILNELKITNSPLRPFGKAQGSAGQAKSKIQKGQTKEESLILKLLENEAMNFDEIVRRSNLKSSKLGSLLSLMEVKGLIKSLDGGMFSINN